MDSSSDSPSSYRSLSPRNVDCGLWSRLRAQARNATQKEPLPSSPRGSISSPRRRSPRSRSSSPRKKSVGSGSPTLAKRRGGQSPRVEAPLATAMGGTFSSRSSNHNNQEEDYLGGGDDYGDELYDDANDVSELNQTDGDLEFLGRFVARGYGGRKKDQVPTRRAGGMSWEVDMR